jgi:ABC-type lipoprotein release transport system permease subunit
MNIFKTYIKGDIKNNRESYNSTRITIFLAIVILSTFIFSVSSFFKSYIDMPNDNMGGSQFRIISTISSKDANNLISNRHIKKIGFFNTKELEEGFGSKEKTRLFKMDDNAMSTKQSALKEGKLPKEGQAMISDDMAKEIDKGLGDNIEIEDKIYHISGIYYDTTHEYQNFYNIYLNINQEALLNSKEELSPFIWYKNIYKTYSLSEEIMNNLETQEVTYGYNDLYLNRSFVIDSEKSLLKDYISHVLIMILFIIAIILFYSIIVNLFLVQESKSIEEYSRLKTIGATNKDISKIIKLKAMYISQIPITLGILFSLVLVKILFLIINKVDKYFSGGKDIYSIYMYLDLKLDFRLILFVYILSFLIIYLGTKKPIKKLKKSFILDGLKGNIKGKSHKKHDLKYTENIEKDLSKQFYKNSKYAFRFTNITLKLGFLLMVFIMIGITYYSMDKKYNRISKYGTYDIQGEYATLNPLNEDIIKEIKELGIEDLVNFRKEAVSLNFDSSMVSNEYKDIGSLSGLEEEIDSFDNMRIEIFGIEDEKFKKLALEKGLDPDNYIGNKVILLNTMGDDFNIPVSEMKNIKFLKDDIKELSLSEYGGPIEINGASTRGHEFTLNVEDKIDTPLFDYSIIKNGLNVYMPKSQYIELFTNFLRIADLNQYEYISIKTDNIEEVQESISNMSLEYFKADDYFLESKLDEEKLVKKRNIIGSILAMFLSLFFIVVGFSNSYFSFYNLFLKRKDQFLLYKSIGMDKKLLESILEQEKRKILFNFIYLMPFIVLAVTYIGSKLFTIFRPIDFLLNLNYLFILVILGYILIIYVSISKMYNKYKKEIIGN